MSQFHSLITNYGEQLIAQAIANKTPLPLKTMAIGDGNGKATTPKSTQTALVREVYRAEITDLLQDSQSKRQIIAELLVPETIGGFTVREIGLFDEQNKLVAVANCPENYKPVLEDGSGKVQYYRIILRVSSNDAVTLSINNNIIYATRVELNQLTDNLAAPDGFKYIGECESIAQLRTIEPTADQQRILVKSYYAGKNLGGGVFYADFGDNETADNGVTLFVTAGGKRWKRVYSMLNIFDFGVRLDRENAAEIDLLQSWHEPVLGLGKVLPVNRKLVPAHHISQVAYKYDGIEYLSDDFLKMDCAQITRTGHYTAWTQDKAFVHDNVIYVPFLLAYGHRFDDIRLAWVKSFDNGNTWTTPEILLDYHPQNKRLGWHCFSMGVIGNRLFMVIEEREAATKKMIRSFLYSRTMTRTFHPTGGISQDGNVVTVSLPEHGLFTGDSLYFSNSGVAGVSGRMTVASVIDENRFTLNHTVSQTANNTGKWSCATSFEDNEWRIQELGSFANSQGLAATHLHSFCKINGAMFAFGFHNGESPRESGYITARVNWNTGSVETTKVTFPDTLSRAVAEPCLFYYQNQIYMTTRSQNPNVGSLLLRCDVDGRNLSSFQISSHAIHYTNLPLHIEDGVIYMFAMERAENEWETGISSTRYEANRPRLFLIQHKLSDWGKPEKSQVQVLTQGIYSGEIVNSACGVGSVVYKDGVLFYLFGDEDHRNGHALTENARNANNANLDNGIQPEIYALRVVLDKKTTGMLDKPLKGADNLTLPVFRGTDGVRTVESPLKFKEICEFISLKAQDILTSGSRNYGVVGADIDAGQTRLFLSSTGKASSGRGALIALHNENSDTPNRIDYKASLHAFSGEMKAITPAMEANAGEVVTAKWVRGFTTVARQEYSATMSGTAAEHTEQSFQVTGSVEAHPDGRIVQRFHLKDIRLIWFAHEDSAIANGKNAGGSAGRELLLDLWTAMPRRISAVNATPVRATNAETSHHYAGEAAEIRAAWSLFEQGTVKSRCGITLARTHGGMDEPFDLLVTVEGY